MKAFRLKIHGVVQGVWYRASTKDRAEEYGVAGWVRNAVDGSVEAHVQGPDEAVEKILQWCRQGPSGARVEKVDVEQAEPEPDLVGFVIRR